MASLEISLWPQDLWPQFDRKFRAQCNFVRSLISKAKSNFSHESCHWIILQPSHTLENFEFNSPPQPIQFIHWHTRHTITCQFIPPFFSGKIERIRSKFSPSDFPDPFLFPIIPPPNLSNFNPTTFSEIRNLIFSSQNKQCELDSNPTFLLKLCFDELGINIINFSLSEGIFPSSFKQAIVHPQLKKPSLPDDDLNNFRPISNLNFISKIFEKVVASRI